MGAEVKAFDVMFGKHSNDDNQIYPQPPIQGHNIRIVSGGESPKLRSRLWRKFWPAGASVWRKLLAISAAVVVAAAIGTGAVFAFMSVSAPDQPLAAVGKERKKTPKANAGSTARPDPAKDKEAANGTPAPAGSTGSGTAGQTSSGGTGSASCALPNYPNASCTGVPAGTVLSAFSGDMEITVAGTVVDSRDINGCVIVKAANVTIRKSKITCTSFYAIASYSASDDGGLLVEDVEIDCANHNSTGIAYQGLTARRLKIHGCENGLDAFRDVTLADSYIYDIYEGATGHGDGIQSADGTNVTIDHNTIYANSTTSSININNSAGGPTTTNTTISNNLLAGGAYTLYCPIPASSNFKILNNHFSRIFYSTVGAFGPWTDCQNESQVTGNVYHDSGLPVAL